MSEDCTDKSGSASLRDMMNPEEIARYDGYWNDVADDMLRSNLDSYRKDYGISGMNNNPTRNVTNPQMQMFLDNIGGNMTIKPMYQL